MFKRLATVAALAALAAPAWAQQVDAPAVDVEPPRLELEAEAVTGTGGRVTVRGTARDDQGWVRVEAGGAVDVLERGGAFALEVPATTTAREVAVTVTDRAGHETREGVVVSVVPGRGELPSGLRPGDRIGEYVNAKDGSVLVWVPPGSFRMGSTSGDDDEEPVHRVTFREGFFLGKHEVTWGQYRGFCRETGREAPEPSSSFRSDERHPVHNVSWEDARDYCAWAGLRLPSEAEWEYACRAGSSTAYCFGDEVSDLGRYAWFDDNASGTHAVGGKAANAWGLYDMHGNVWEWVQDAWNDSYHGAPTDGSAWESAGASGRLFRGGGWYYWARVCRSAYRGRISPGVRVDSLGFRPARSLEP